jgi:hypothetical protein
MVEMKRKIYLVDRIFETDMSRTSDKIDDPILIRK